MKIRRVVGESMLPGLAPGDILLVSKKYKPSVGDIVVARRKNMEIVKRVTKISKKRRFTLEGDNKKISTDSRSFGSVPEKDIVGVAVWAVGFSRLKNKSAKKRSRVLHFALGGALACLIVFGVVFGLTQKDHAYSQSNNSVQPQTAIKPVVSPKYSVGATQKDVPYCNGQNLDIYYPRKAVYEKAPVVLYFHGGGWKINDKASEPDQLAMIDPLRDEGFAVVSIDYRKLPDNFFPAPVSDALCSVRYLRATSATTGLDGEKVGVYGFSAGGHLAAMVGVLDSQNAFNEGPYQEQSSRVKAVATLAGIFNFETALRPGYDAKIAYFLNGRAPIEAQPISYVSADDSVFLLVHGLQDQYIDPEQDVLFSAKLTEAGVKNSIVDVQNAEHGLGPMGGEVTPSKADVAKQIREFLKQQILR